MREASDHGRRQLRIERKEHGSSYSTTAVGEQFGPLLDHQLRHIVVPQDHMMLVLRLIAEGSWLCRLGLAEMGGFARSNLQKFEPSQSQFGLQLQV